MSGEETNQEKIARRHMLYSRAKYRFHQKTVLLTYVLCFTPAYLSYGTDANAVLMQFFGFYGTPLEPEAVVLTRLLVAMSVFLIGNLLLWPLREYLKARFGPSGKQYGLDTVEGDADA